MFSLAGARKEIAEDAVTRCPFQTVFLFYRTPCTSLCQDTRERPPLGGFPEGKTGFSVRGDQDGIPFAENPLEDMERQGVLEVLLDGPAKRPRPVGGVVPDLRQPLPGGVGHGNRDLPVREAVVYLPEHDPDDDRKLLLPEGPGQADLVAAGAGAGAG